MNITIYTFCPDNISYYKEGRKEYEKRLSRYCKIKYIQIKNEKQLEKVYAKLSQSSDKEKLIFVSSGSCPGKTDSPSLASFIEQQGIRGISSLYFLVGFPKDVPLSSNEKDCRQSTDHLSVSSMEIETQLLSLVLEEQIYRSYRIIYKEPYHK